MFFPEPLRLALAPVLAAALGAGGIFAPAVEAKQKAPAPEGARLSGRVFENDGTTPAVGVVARVHPLDTGPVPASSPTDDKGRFELEGLAHGYVDLTIEREGALFAGSEVVSLPPEGKVAVDLTLTRLDERSASWWATRGPLQLPGGQGQAAGIAELRPELGGRDFWKSKKGIRSSSATSTRPTRSWRRSTPARARATRARPSRPPTRRRRGPSARTPP